MLGISLSNILAALEIPIRNKVFLLCSIWKKEGGGKKKGRFMKFVFFSKAATFYLLLGKRFLASRISDDLDKDRVISNSY